MPRNMSFMLTTQQMYNKTKTVTRRMGWRFLKPGDIVQAVEKCQGLRKGEKVVKICLIRILSNRPEQLGNMNRLYYGLQEVIKEGFPDTTPIEFQDMFCKSHKGCTPTTFVNRIEFEYV